MKVPLQETPSSSMYVPKRRLYDEYEVLPVGIATISVITYGVRLLQELRLAAVNYRILPVGQVLFYNVEDLFEGEELKDEKYVKRVEKLLQTLEKYSNVLKPVREEVKEKLTREETHP